MVNVIIGSNSSIGQSLVDHIKKKKLSNNYLFFSKSNKNTGKFLKLDLDSDIKILKKLPINKCFFLSSPRYVKKNFSKKKYKKEFTWIKKVVENCNIKKMVYLSSSTIYQKNHFIGVNKLRIERYLSLRKKKFKILQIWRPFNLVSLNQKQLTDHFHNFLFKIIFIQKKKFHLFQGNAEDKRGYSSTNEFVKKLYNFSKKNKSFINNYGNPDLITVKDIIEIFNKNQKKNFTTKLKYKFKSKNQNINSVINLNRKNTIYSRLKSYKVINNFLLQALKNFRIKPKKVFR